MHNIPRSIIVRVIVLIGLLSVLLVFYWPILPFLPAEQIDRLPESNLLVFNGRMFINRIASNRAMFAVDVETGTVYQWTNLPAHIGIDWATQQNDALVLSGGYGANIPVETHLISDGGVIQQLSTINSHDARLAPDGQRIAFTSNYTLFLYDVRTSEIHTLVEGTTLALEPSWSPDGGYIAFISPDTPNSDISKFLIMRIRADGTDLIPISDSIQGAPSAAPLRWSPDGTLLALRYYQPYENRRILNVIHSDGRGNLPLLSIPVADFKSGGGVWDYAWSSDGAYLAFTFEATLDGPSLPWLLDMRGGEARQTPRPDLLAAIGARSVYNLAWSPDGKQLALDMSSNESHCFAVGVSGGQSCTTNIYIYNMTDGSIRRLTNRWFDSVSSLAWLETVRR